ncbi:vWA domain-containing protein [Alteromonas sp. CYL-A6]|uniref:vWA domain-containing protein n=1 Tax=Alteromonas nitratireducens TaxID=3390813 RepID=UPI0034C49D53
MNEFLTHFHFLRPGWLIALLPLALLLCALFIVRRNQSGWQSVIPHHLYQFMIKGTQSVQRKPPLGLLGLGWLIATLALAGPTWQKLPQPVFQLKRGHVVVIDMSLSMRATDVTPDRLTRAKYKAIDLVNQLGEGETGLIAYAGDAFVISPLTEDAATITALLPSLRPEIMPVAGSDPLLGIQSAAELLTNAGYQKGDIFWLTDGIEPDQVSELQNYISGLPYTVSVLGVGTAEGAPVKQLNGELLKDRTGSIVIPRLQASALERLASAGNGIYSPLSADDRDITALTALSLTDREAEETESEDNQGDAWKEAGPWLVLMLLPLAAYGFRRGLLFCVALLTLGLNSADPVMAQENAPDTQSGYQPPTWWQQPFMNDDQTGKAAYDQKAYRDAAATFADPLWRGASLYEAGDYEAALDAFRQSDSVEATYNQGNALARLGKLDDAIAAYDDVLRRQPDHTAAAENKALLEQLKSQQQNNQDNQNQQDPSDNSDNGSSQDNASQSNGSQNSGSQNSGDQSSGSQNSDGNNTAPEQGNKPPSAADDNRQQVPQSSAQSQQGSESDPVTDDAQADTQSMPAATEPSLDDDSAAAPRDATAAGTEMTDEEREAQQRLDNLMRRVPDDPAFLLKRKMQLEAQKRQRQRLPANRRDW